MQRLSRISPKLMIGRCVIGVVLLIVHGLWSPRRSEVLSFYYSRIDRAVLTRVNHKTIETPAPAVICDGGAQHRYFDNPFGRDVDLVQVMFYASDTKPDDASFIILQRSSDWSFISQPHHLKTLLSARDDLEAAPVRLNRNDRIHEEVSCAPGAVVAFGITLSARAVR